MLLLALQQTRDTALEEAALVCDDASELGHEDTASAIRSLKHGTPASTSALGLPGDWEPVMDEVWRATRKFPTWPTDPLHAPLFWEKNLAN